MSSTVDPGEAGGPDEPGPTTDEPVGAAGPPTEPTPGPRVDAAIEPRPAPHATSLAGAIAAALMLSSLVIALSQLGDHRRLGGILIGLGFEVVGVLLVVAHRGRRAQAAGVGLSAIGLIPLLVYLFVDVDDPSGAIDSVGGFTGTATAILLVAAALWAVAYRFGPARGYGIYLGGALVALWLVAVVQIVDQPLSQMSANLSGTSKFTPVGSVVGSDGFGDTTTYDPYDPYDPSSSFDSSDPFDSYSSDDPYSSDDSYSYLGPGSDPYQPVDDPSTRLGWISLVFGGGYLALAGVSDRRGNRRRATPLLAAAIPILTVAVAYLGGSFGTVGTSLLAMALGAAGIYLGTVVAAPDGRRFTSWFGAAAVTVGLLVLVDDVVDDGKVAAAVLLVLGALVAFGADRLDRRGSPPPDGSDEGTVPEGPTSGADAPLTAPTAPAPPPEAPQDPAAGAAF